MMVEPVGGIVESGNIEGKNTTCQTHHTFHLKRMNQKISIQLHPKDRICPEF